MEALLKYVSVRWHGTAPLHLVCYLLEHANLLGVERDLKATRAATPLFLRWGDRGAWACNYTTAAGLNHFGVNPLDETSPKVAKHVHIHDLDDGETGIDSIWQVILRHYGLKRVPKPALHQRALLAARCWIDAQDHGRPEQRLSYNAAAALHALDLERKGRGMFRRALGLIRQIETRTRQKHARGRAWIEPYLRPVWMGEVALSPAHAHTEQVLKTTDALAIGHDQPSPPDDPISVVFALPNASGEPGSSPFDDSEEDTLHFDTFDTLRELSESPHIEVSDLIRSMSREMVVSAYRDRKFFLSNMLRLLTEVAHQA